MKRIGIFWWKTIFTFALPAIAVSCLEASIPVQAAVLEEWSFDPQTLQLQILLNETTQPRYFVLSQPTRIVVDLPGTWIGRIPTQQNYSGAVQKIRVSQFQKGVTRIVMDLQPGTILDQRRLGFQRVASRRGVRWLLSTSATSSYPTMSGSPPYTNPDIPNVDPSSSQLPPAIFPLNPNQVVSVPPLDTSSLSSASPRVPLHTTSSRSNTSPRPPKTGMLEFGQPIPGDRPTLSPQSSNIVLPIGAKVNLRYQGNSLYLQPGSTQPSALLLVEDLRDRAGNIIAPSGTPVFGRFQTSRDGSRFISEAISLSGNYVPLVAHSNLLNRNPTLQPGQTLQIRLIEDLARR